MNVADLYENSKKPVVSFEFFRREMKRLQKSFDKITDDLAAIKPDYMSVTFGAGGSTKEGSYQTVKNLIDKNLPTVAYLAGYGLRPDEITAVLNGYQDLGVETIFVIRGDKPTDDSFIQAPDSFSYASEMIPFIKERYNFTLGCAGYPEGHIQAESLEKDIAYLKLKEANGAAYVIAQYCYDNNDFIEYIQKCRGAGISIPIIPGIMPVYTVKLTRTLSKVCGTTLPEKMQGVLDQLSESDKDAVLNYGIDFAVEQCRGLLESGVPGLHFYTMNRSKSTTEIIARLRRENLL